VLFPFLSFPFLSLRSLSHDFDGCVSYMFAFAAVVVMAVVGAVSIHSLLAKRGVFLGLLRFQRLFNMQSSVTDSLLVDG
jgi:hypothetical protein